MSGFCAIYAWRGAPIDRDLLQRMRQKMSHRGEVPSCSIDISVGLAAINWRFPPPLEQMSVLWQSETSWVAADARLDYRRDLLKKLNRQTSMLASVSDSDLIIASYAQWGEACVNYLEGDYAFVLWDTERQRIFGARSIVGLRPFVYHVTPRRFLCASEPQQLFEDATVSHELNTAWVAFWLTQGQGHWDGTIYHDIQVLAPGHLLTVDTEGVKIKSFWQPPLHRDAGFTRQEEYTQQFRRLLTDAIQTRIQDHRRLYFDLSGGLDSSSLVSLAAEQWAQEEKSYRLDCFHVQSDGSLPYVEAVANKYPVTNIHTCLFSDHLHFDGAFDPAPWIALPCRPTLVLASLYREQWAIATKLGAQVHIRGDFGDELLGASLSYLSTYWKEHHVGMLIHELMHWHHVDSFPSRAILEQWIIHPILRHRSQERIERKGESTLWLRPGVLQQSRERIQLDEFYFRQMSPDPFTRERVRWMSFHTDYTIQADVALSFAGLETREPYTDRRLIEFLLSTPPQYQIRPDQRKFLLRDAMQGILPDSIRQRKGKGRAYRLYFQAFKKHREQLRQMVIQMPELLTPYIDQAPLLTAIDTVALGGQANVPALSGALSLVLWAHRLPWTNGSLPVVPG